MLQVKVFDEEHEEDLENDINDFLKQNPAIEVRDIQFRTCCTSTQEEQLYCFSALISYAHNPK